MYLSHSGLGCRPFLGGGSVDVHSAFIVAPIVEALRLFLCFVLQYCVSFVALQSPRCESLFLYFVVFLVSCDCFCYVALPHGAVDWSIVRE